MPLHIHRVVLDLRKFGPRPSDPTQLRTFTDLCTCGALRESAISHTGESFWGPWTEMECQSCHHPLSGHDDPPLRNSAANEGTTACTTCRWCGCPRPVGIQEILSC
jgi:hypothetical protein